MKSSTSMPRGEVRLDVREAVREREGELRDGVRAGFGHVVAGDRDAVEVPDLVGDEPLLHVGHAPQRELGREDARVLALVLLEDVGLHGAADPTQHLRRLELGMLVDGGVEVHREDGRRRAVDRHRHRGRRIRRGRSRRRAPSCRRAWRSTRPSSRPSRRCRAARRDRTRTSVTESNAVDRRVAGWSCASRWNRRFVRAGPPSPANIRAGSSPSRFSGKTPAVNGKWPGRCSRRTNRSSSPSSSYRGIATLGTDVPDSDVRTSVGDRVDAPGASRRGADRDREGAPSTSIPSTSLRGEQVLAHAGARDPFAGLGVVPPHRCRRRRRGTAHAPAARRPSNRSTRRCRPAPAGPPGGRAPTGGSGTAR